MNLLIFREGGDGEFISVDDRRAKWANKRRSGFLVFTKMNFKNGVKCLL